MITLDLTQGSQEWLDVRAKHLTASEAPAMLGLSKYKTRSELMREKSTGIAPEIDAATQRRFDAGHEAEAATRKWAEDMIGEDLYPTTGSAVVDGLHLLASFDGINLDETICWENKLWNAEFAKMVDAGIVPDTHWPQLEQQLLVSGAEKVLFTVSDGDSQITYVWYESIPERRTRLIAGWKQFMAELQNYQHVETAKPAPGRAPETLPALHVEVTGMVTASNLAQFKETALAVFKSINTDLQSDADFANAEKTVKWCKEVEDRLEQTKQHALSQTTSIEELFRTMDGIKEEARTVRLTLDKLVKTEKESRKAEIIVNARKAIEEHVQNLNVRIGGNWMPAASAAAFAEAIKGLKSLDSMREKVGNALRDMMFDASQMADRIEANRKSLTGEAHDWMFLFPDFQAVCQKAVEDFAALLSMRVTNHKAAEEKRLEAERERIRAEERAKAEAEAQAKAKAEQSARDAEELKKRAEFEQMQAAEQAQGRAALAEADRLIASAKAAPAETQSAEPIEPAETADSVNLLRIGQINERLGFSVTAEFIASLGINPAAHDRSAKLYREVDFTRLCNALIDKITTARNAQYQPTN